MGQGLSIWQNLSVRWARFVGSVGSKIDDRGNASVIGSCAITISAQQDNTNSRWDTNLNAVVLRYDHVGARHRM